MDFDGLARHSDISALLTSWQEKDVAEKGIEEVLALGVPALRLECSRLPEMAHERSQLNRYDFMSYLLLLCIWNVTSLRVYLFLPH